MKRVDIEKNRLDLAYRRYLQLVNVVLIIGAGSFVAYLAGLILNPDKVFQYTFLLVAISLISYFFYQRLDGGLKSISEEIRGLEN